MRGHGPAQSILHLRIRVSLLSTPIANSRSFSLLRKGSKHETITPLLLSRALRVGRFFALDDTARYTIKTQLRATARGEIRVRSDKLSSLALTLPAESVKTVEH